MSEMQTCILALACKQVISFYFWNLLNPIIPSCFDGIIGFNRFLYKARKNEAAAEPRVAMDQGSYHTAPSSVQNCTTLFIYLFYWSSFARRPTHTDGPEVR